MKDSDVNSDSLGFGVSVTVGEHKTRTVQCSQRNDAMPNTAMAGQKACSPKVFNLRAPMRAAITSCCILHSPWINAWTNKDPLPKPSTTTCALGILTYFERPPLNKSESRATLQTQRKEQARIKGTTPSVTYSNTQGI